MLSAYPLLCSNNAICLQNYTNTRLDNNCSHVSRATVWAPEYFYYVLYLHCRPCIGRSLVPPILFGITGLIGGSFAPVFIGMGCVLIVVILCFISVVLGGWVYWSVVGWAPFSLVSLRGVRAGSPCSMLPQRGRGYLLPFRAFC